MSASEQPLPAEVWVDIRPQAAFDAGHVPDSLSFPAPELPRRGAELPPRLCLLVLVTDDALVSAEDMAAVRAFLDRARWVVAKSVAADARNCTAVGPPRPADRCWAPSPFLARVLADPALAVGSARGGVAIDFGCGAGRDMALLALRGWCVVGIDNRPHLAAQARALGERHRDGGGYCDAAGAHLLRRAPLRPATADLVLMVRFLQRPLLPAMLRALRPGGLFVASHFVDGVQHSAVGTPKSPDAYLLHGELAAAAATAGLDVLIDEEDVLDDGRPVVNFAARRNLDLALPRCES